MKIDYMDDTELIPTGNESQKRLGTGNDAYEYQQDRQPSDKNSFKFIYILILIVIVIAGVFGYKWYQNNMLYPEQTKKELSEIRNALYQYKESFDAYPNQLTVLAKSRPLREIWLTDAWDNSYRYETDESNQTFTITSAGSDEKFGTDDDIQIE